MEGKYSCWWRLALKDSWTDAVTPKHDSSLFALGGDSPSVYMFDSVDEAAKLPSSVIVGFKGCTNRCTGCC
jgi:hypothetical protein